MMFEFKDMSAIIMDPVQESAVLLLIVAEFIELINMWQFCKRLIW